MRHLDSLARLGGRNYLQLNSGGSRIKTLVLCDRRHADEDLRHEPAAARCAAAVNCRSHERPGNILIFVNLHSIIKILRNIRRFNLMLILAVKQ